jgi:hypothetical protein
MGVRDCLETYPPVLLSKAERFYGELKRGVSPSYKSYFPLSFEGEGDKGGEVNKSPN